ncbi:MAG: peptidoglycan-associated lipoprotein Pal [Gallionellaceae bacterium]|nr:MAG: peptidoglycan-associated lipoprotein Pal [Gallionellaceae bacterium]
MKKIVIGAILASMLSACAANKPKEPVAQPKAEPVAVATPAPVAETPVVGGATTPDVNAQALAKAEADAKTKAEADAAAQAVAKEAAEVAAKTEAAPKIIPPADPAGALTQRSVHFPFDVDAIQDNDKQTIQAHGAFLGNNPERKVRTEGNADERGSSEYNLALGQRRANNTKKALALTGAKTEQIEAISYGEERPVATGHDEASWAQNRRVDIIYK